MMIRYSLSLFLLLLALPALHAQVISSGFSACAVLADGSVRCWGHNEYGQLGQGDTDNRGDEPGEMGADLPAIDLGAGRTATDISIGLYHICALLTDGGVKCWGRNNDGQLGQGDTENRGDEAGELGDNLPEIGLGAGRTATAIATGGYHTCALLDDGSVKCWGRNDDGQLGQGDTDALGGTSGQMGDDLKAVDLGNGRTATAITTGGFHTCVLLDNDEVKCWGGNKYGQLGRGDTHAQGDDSGEMGDDLDAVDLGTGRTATQVVAGRYHTCALLDDDGLKCWGFNTGGQLGQGDSDDRGDDSNEMGDNLPAVDLGAGRTATQIAAGNNHTCALLDDGSLKCWGSNSFGQLGLGDRDARGDDAGELGDGLTAVDLGSGRTATAVASGFFDNTCVVLDDKTVRCWGDNYWGQLGLGDTNARGGAGGEMGDALTAVDLGGDALPVELVRFTATLDGAAAHLRWTTASETNNAGFEVEHRSGTDSFRSIGFIAGQGTTAEANSYDFTTGALAPGHHAFRLRQVDFDGASTYSAEVELTLDAAGISLMLFGNPARGQIRGSLTLPAAQQPARIVLYDALGRSVQVQEGVSGAFSLDASDLSAGAYVLLVETGAETITRQVVVVR